MKKILSSLIFCCAFLFLAQCSHLPKVATENPLEKKFKQGEALVAQQKWKEAESILNEVKVSAVDRRPDLAAQSAYLLAEIYENTAAEEKALVSLKEALNLGHLPVQDLWAKIPVRQAVLFSKLNQPDQALEYLQSAEKGLLKLKQSENLSQEQWAELYYKMGQVSLQTLSPENISESLLSSKNVQAYLFKSFNLQIKPWSDKSEKLIYDNYQKFYQFWQRSQEDTQLGSEILDILYHAELFAPINTSEVVEGNQLFKYISQLKGSIEQKLYAKDEANPLTEESLKNNSLKRNLKFQR